MKKQIAKFDKNTEEVKGIVKIGGYYQWSWEFPFRHFIKEEIIITPFSFSFSHI